MPIPGVLWTFVLVFIQRSTGLVQHRVARIVANTALGSLQPILVMQPSFAALTQDVAHLLQVNVLVHGQNVLKHLDAVNEIVPVAVRSAQHVGRCNQQVDLSERACLRVLLDELL